MATLAETMQGERMARVALSMFAEPNDATTGCVLAHVSGIETLQLTESDHPVPGLARADALMWRERLAARITFDLPGRVAEALDGEFGSRGSQASHEFDGSHVNLRLIASASMAPACSMSVVPVPDRVTLVLESRSGAGSSSIARPRAG
ncbi:hypothetical protein GCM10009718_36890 [Isoptericola halotolerans]|uniref:Uncharacterized protein n=1 Tax=Isoptericola halotolerans TaxID=300560 RepID=A0ABX2A7B1_9MICO|nr:hypothetical protein [Isoptericola halotolerans]